MISFHEKSVLSLRQNYNGYHATLGDVIDDNKGSNSVGLDGSADGVTMEQPSYGSDPFLAVHSGSGTFFIKNGLTQKTIDHYTLADGSQISHADLVGDSLQTQVNLTASNEAELAPGVVLERRYA